MVVFIYFFPFNTFFKNGNYNNKVILMLNVNEYDDPVKLTLQKSKKAKKQKNKNKKINK